MTNPHEYIEQDRELKIGQLYRHFKGGLYRALYEAKDSETQKPVVVYQNVSTGDVWVRDKKMFLETLDKEKYIGDEQTYRFQDEGPGTA